MRSLIWLSSGLMLGFALCVALLSFAHQDGANPLHVWQNANKVVDLLLSGWPSQAALSEDSSVQIGQSVPAIRLDAAAIEEIEGIHLQGSPLLKPGAKVTPPPAEEVAILEELQRLEQAERTVRSADRNRADGDQ